MAKYEVKYKIPIDIFDVAPIQLIEIHAEDKEKVKNSMKQKFLLEPNLEILDITDIC